MVIGIDFDGTCVTHDYPNIGKDIGAVPILKRLVDNGHKLILNTMRSKKDPACVRIEGNDYLTQAVEWFKENEIPLYGVHKNPEQDYWTSSPKAYCDLYIDDAGLGCPLRYDPKLSGGLFVDWVRVEEILEGMNLI